MVFINHFISWSSHFSNFPTFVHWHWCSLYCPSLALRTTSVLLQFWPYFISALVFAPASLAAAFGRFCFVIHLACAKFSLNFWGSQNSCAQCPGLEEQVHIACYLSRTFSGFSPAGVLSLTLAATSTADDADLMSKWLAFLCAHHFHPATSSTVLHRKILRIPSKCLLLSWENLIVGTFHLFPLPPPFLCLSLHW